MTTAALSPLQAAPYSWLLLIGIAGTLWWWSRLARRDERLLIIYVAALVSAFLGAKVVYLAAEGWMFWDSPDRWRIWATGKTILGALLGGYAGVELAKKLTGYTRTTGDWFALIAPAGIILGRLGCLLHGCCPGRECPAQWWTQRDLHGVDRWPAVPMEIGFNVVALAVFAGLGQVGRGASEMGAAPGSTLPSRPPPLASQHFHLYLIAYGLFRFGHEFLRATPRVGFGFTGYHVAALAVLGLGVLGFVRRRRALLSGALVE